MSNLEMAGVAVSASNPVPFFEISGPVVGAGTVNRTLIGAATGLAAGSSLAVASNALRQSITFTNTSGANAYLAGAGQVPTYSASEAKTIWDIRIPANGVLFMDRNAMLPGSINVTFDGQPGGYLHSSEVSA